MTTGGFATLIRARMAELDMSNAELAVRLGVTPTRVRQLLHHQAQMNETTFRRMCAAVYLRVSVTPIPIGERDEVWPALPIAPWRDAHDEPPPVAQPATLPR